MTLVGQTLAGVAHELNNPLTALMGYADLLKMRDVPEKLSVTLDKIREQAVRATRIVKNLLSVARQRKSERIAGPPRAGGRVGGRALRLRGAPQQRAASTWTIPEDLPQVLGDPHALQQIYVNLVQNAIHALKEYDGDPRTISHQDGGPPRRHPVDGHGLRLGHPAGPARTDLRAVLHHEGRRQGHGPRPRALPHGGPRSRRRPAPRRGPRRRRPIRPAPADHSRGRTCSGAAAAAPNQGDIELRVLVVDDETLVREALAAQLGGLGCEVTSTAIGQREAMQKLAEQEYDALLVDVRMPETSGVEFHDLVAKSDPTRARRMVFMTGDFTNEEIQDAVRSTGRRLLEKPFTVEELRTALLEHAPKRKPTRNGNGKPPIARPCRARDAAGDLGDLLRGPEPGAPPRLSPGPRRASGDDAREPPRRRDTPVSDPCPDRPSEGRTRAPEAPSDDAGMTGATERTPCTHGVLGGFGA